MVARSAFAALTVLLFLAPLLALPASAVQYQPGDEVFRVRTEHYELVFNLTGGAITSWVWKETDTELVECAEPAGRVAVAGVDLSTARWNYSIVYNSSDVLVVKFYPVQPPSSDYTVEAYYTFYQTKPYIDVEYVVKSTSDQPVSLYGNLLGALTTYWTALSGEPESWRLLYYDVSQGSVMETLGGFTDKALWVGAVDNASQLFVGVVPLQQTQLLGVNLGKENCVALEVRFRKAELAPGATLSYRLRIYYGAFQPRWLDEAGLVGAASHINSTLYNDYELVAKKPDWYVEQLRKLRSDNMNLTRQVNQLKLNVTQLQGEVESCQSNLAYWQNRVSSTLNAERQRLLVQRYIFLAAGVVFGFIAALAAFQLGAAEALERIFKRGSRG